MALSKKTKVILMVAALLALAGAAIYYYQQKKKKDAAVELDKDGNIITKPTQTSEPTLMRKLA